MPYQVIACGFSDVGLVRKNNEDIWQSLPKLGFYVLADGMGGHRAGEVASLEATNFFCGFIQDSFQEDLSLEEAKALLHRGICLVNEEIYRMGSLCDDLRGMGTTLCCLLFLEEGLVYANVGDSRIYRLRNGELMQITKDHSLLRELVDIGQVGENRITSYLYKNILTKAIGTEGIVEPSVYTSEVFDGDVYLMCSDGLSDMLSSKEMEKILNALPEPEAASHTLITAAKEKGGYDNITVVIAKVNKTHETKKTGISRQ